MKKSVCLFLCLCLFCTFLSGCAPFENVQNLVRNAREIVTKVSNAAILPAEFQVDPSGEAVLSEEQKQRFCYASLNENQQRIYRMILPAVRDCVAGQIGLGNCLDNALNDLSVAFFAVSYDYPEIYWMPKHYRYSTIASYFSISFEDENDSLYLFSREEIAADTEEFEDAVTRITDKIDPGMSDFEKEEILIRELCKRARYTEEGDKTLYSAYGALVNGEAVCEGYARAFQLLCNRVSIPCKLVVGESQGEGHMWNLVQIENNWYHMDPTWMDIAEVPDFYYFNVSTRRITEDHTIAPDFREASYQETNTPLLNYGLNETDETEAAFYFQVYSDRIYRPDAAESAARIAEAAADGKEDVSLLFSRESDWEFFAEQCDEQLADISAILADTDFRRRHRFNRTIQLKQAIYNQHTVSFTFE